MFGGLFAQPQSFNHVLVTLRILTTQIRQMAAALSHQLQQSPTGMFIMLVGLQVFDELVDPLGQQGHLHFGRAGVVFV